MSPTTKLRAMSSAMSPTTSPPTTSPTTQPRQASAPRQISARAVALGLGLLALAILAVPLAGCGGSANTVSVSGAPAGTPVTSATGALGKTATTGTTATAGAARTSPGGAGSGGTPAATTRTATAPAFVEKGSGGGGSGGGSGGGATAEGLPAALAVVRTHGFTVKDASDYHPNQTLRVLVGAGARSGEGYEKQAFFFIDGRYLGTDTSAPSAQVSIVSQDDTEVTLAYALYRPNDSLCCPSAGQARVRFQLNNGRLAPLDPIPPTSSSTAPSRR